MYIVAILGNITILYIVKREQSLHEPMYYFLCMLAVTDLALSTSIVPKTLSIFWFNSREIAFGACFTQLHSTILTNSIVAKISLAVVLRGFMIILPIPIMGSRWPYCKTNIIPHTYCKHFSVVSLACADIRPSSYYSVCVTFIVPSVDGFLIAVSYTQILRTIFRLPTNDARFKAFGTCGTHLCALSALYIPDLFVSLMQRIGSYVPLPVLILMANVNLLVHPMLHPIIYGVRTKQIRDRLLWIVTQKRA
ncbi:olfactory receptor 52B2-like [Pelodiscus sinensis]|uniref:olfactory receptor 52B2-like n=1 Tax=Pelodiscus sinensis TaxID=13735 RepID=UPI003F6B743F